MTPVARTARRVQRQRKAGWRMPAGAVYVGRPGPFGNPFPADYFGREQAVRLYRQWLAGDDNLGYPDADRYRSRILANLTTLTGRDLACWCPLDKLCHADVLLTLANEGLAIGFGEQDCLHVWHFQHDTPEPACPACGSEVQG